MRLKSPTQVFRMDGKNCFAEVLCSSLGIDKIAINFLTYDASQNKGNRETGHITIYIDIFEARVLAGDILNGSISALKGKEMKRVFAGPDLPENKGRTVYPKPIYELVGGTCAEHTVDHKPICRQFQIAPGTKQPWTLTATSGPGKTVGNGLIVPNGRPATVIRIGLDDKTLKMFAYALETCASIWSQAKFLPVVEPVMAEVRVQIQRTVNELVSQKKQEAPSEDAMYDDSGIPDSPVFHRSFPDKFPY